MNCDWTLSPLVNSLIFTLTLFPPTQANSDITHTHTHTHLFPLPHSFSIPTVYLNAETSASWTVIFPEDTERCPSHTPYHCNHTLLYINNCQLNITEKQMKQMKKKTYTVKTAWPLLLLQQTYGEGHRLYLCICFVTGTSRNPGSAQRLSDSMGLFLFPSENELFCNKMYGFNH